MALANQSASPGDAGALSSESHGSITAIAAGDGPVHIPDAAFLFNAEFQHAGSDLKLVGPDGHELLITGYFSAGAPVLAAPNHATIDGQTVTLLAGPQHPGQYAQAGAPQHAGNVIGKVETLQGEVTVQHADGTTQALRAGDPVFENDVISTGAGSQIGMKLSDGTLFSLQESSRLAINDFVYQADGDHNSALLNVIQGTFSLLAGQVAPSGDMKIQTPIATMGIRGTSILGVKVDSIFGHLSLTNDPDGHIGFIEIFNNANGNLFTVLRTVFDKITISDNGMLSLTPKTPEELATDQNLTQLLHDFYSQVPQSGPDETPRPQSGSHRFAPPNIQEINFDNTPPPPDSQELLLPATLLEQFVEFLLQNEHIRDEIVLSLQEAPSAGSVVLGDRLEGADADADTGEGGDPVMTTLPFDFGTSGPGSVGFANLDGQAVVDANGDPVTNGGDPLTYVWDPATNTLTAVEPGGQGPEDDKPIFSIEVNPTTGEVTVSIIGAVDHFGANDESLSVDVPFTVQAANGESVTGTLTVGIGDDEPVAHGDVAEVSSAQGEAPADSNVIILMDTSRTMNRSSGDDEGHSRLDLAKTAAMTLLTAAGLNQALVIDFANHVHDSNWQSPNDAHAYVAGLTAGGGRTNLDDALWRVVNEYGNADPADHTYIYVISDGGASSDSGPWWHPTNGNDVNGLEEFFWKLGLLATGVDGVFGYSVGDNGDEQLLPVGWDPSDPFHQQTVQMLDDPNQLLDHFYDQTGYELPVAMAEGNVLTGDGNIPGTDGADDFGADGLGHISSVVIDGETYTDPGQGDHSIEVPTAQGGSFTFHFADGPEGEYAAGDWEYTAPLYGNTLPYENLQYTIQDGDGDTSTSNLIIEIDPDAIQNVDIRGEGDDTLISDPDAVDVLVGGTGADTFELNGQHIQGLDIAYNDNIGNDQNGPSNGFVEDFIADYNFSEGDQIDLSALLPETANAGNINDYVRISEQGPGAVDQLQVDPTGQGHFQTVAHLDAGSVGDMVKIVVDDSGTNTNVTNPGHIA